MYRVARLVTALVAVVFAVGASVAAATHFGAIDAGADVSAVATRGRVAQQGELAPITPRVTLISDSVFAAFRYVDASVDLTNADWTLKLRACRRLVITSCPVASGYPPTAVEEIQQMSAAGVVPAAEDVLVIATGYNDYAHRFEADFRIVMDAARAGGWSTVAWVTYRTRQSAATLEGGATGRFATMNQVLVDAQASGDYPDLWVWDFSTVSALHPEWFGADGIHLSSVGPGPIARWMSTFLTVSDD